MSNPRLDWMDKPVTLRINGGEAAIILGLLTREWSAIRRDPNRQPYHETLSALRQKLIGVTMEAERS
jgi:hypothetical protein